jgi:threonine/homoserine/homoserine lactone efflux protein
MELSALAIFALALAIAAGSPGPSIAALVARVLVRGWRDVVPFVAAMWLGEALWLVLAVLGLAALAETFHWAFLVVKYCGVVYLLYLAWQMWRAPVAVSANRIGPRAGHPLRMFMAGLTVTLGNPKIMAFYLALLPTIVDLGGVTALGLLELALTMLVVIATVDIAWIALAERARRLLSNPRALRAANRVSASLMGGAAAAIAAR